VRNSSLGDTTYRADIDGLRAISILLVVGYHAQSWLVPGGFIGVDIFFVISGFLITRIITARLDNGSLSPLDFYARRVRRIFPALIVVLLASYLVGWLVLLPDAFVRLGDNIAASAAFASNLLQLGQISYFAPDATENPLLHLWSLGIEEQFYIVWPPILMLLSRSKYRQAWMFGMAAASFATSLLIFAGYKNWTFYFLVPRAWELLAGGLLADQQPLGLWSNKQNDPKRHDLLVMFGIALIAGAAFGLNRGSLFPGPYALLPTVGAALIIVSPHSRISRLLLANRPMVLLGRISYPLYLWHWPLLSYLIMLRNGVPNALEIWAAVTLAVALSWLTFRFVETPIRQKPNIVPKLASGLISVAAAGIVTAAASGFEIRFPPEIRDIAQIKPDQNSGFSGSCFSENPGSNFGPGCIEPGNKRLLFLWGDSTAAALYPGLKQAEKNFSFRLANFTAAACAPILLAGRTAACDRANDIAFSFIKSSRPDIVLMHAMWGTNSDLADLGETIRQLKALGIPQIVVLGPVPVWKRTLPHALVNSYRFLHSIPDRIQIGVSESDSRLEAFSEAVGVDYLSAWNILCNAEGCLTRVGHTADDVLTTDIVHLSVAGSRFLVDAIAARLFEPDPASHARERRALAN